MLFIRCEVKHDLGLKLMMRIDGVQNYKGNMPYVVLLTLPQKQTTGGWYGSIHEYN